MPSVQFAAAAGRDIDSVSTWWAENRGAAPALFDSELVRSLERVSDHPEIGAVIRRRGTTVFRSLRMRRTRYRIMYCYHSTASKLKSRSTTGAAYLARDDRLPPMRKARAPLVDGVALAPTSETELVEELSEEDERAVDEAFESVRAGRMYSLDNILSLLRSRQPK